MPASNAEGWRMRRATRPSGTPSTACLSGSARRSAGGLRRSHTKGTAAPGRGAAARWLRHGTARRGEAPQHGSCSAAHRRRGEALQHGGCGAGGPRVLPREGRTKAGDPGRQRWRGAASAYQGYGGAEARRRSTAAAARVAREQSRGAASAAGYEGVWDAINAAPRVPRNGGWASASAHQGYGGAEARRRSMTVVARVAREQRRGAASAAGQRGRLGRHQRGSPGPQVVPPQGGGVAVQLFCCCEWQLGLVACPPPASLAVVQAPVARDTYSPRDRAAEGPGRKARSGRQRSQGWNGRSFQQAAAYASS